MKKKILIVGLIILIGLIIGIILFKNRDEKDDKDVLYSVNFGNTIIRFKHVDYVIPQNRIVIVEKSIDKGKTFESITKEAITVSMEPKFVFLNENQGFAIKKPKIMKDNGKYMGMYVTLDGGKTFTLSKINYDNPNIETLTIKDVPYYDNNRLILPCSIYQVKSDQSGYENVDLYFTTNDNGLTWNLVNDLLFSIKKDSLTNKGATFILKNNSDDDYCYGPEYILEKYVDNKWKEILLDEPLSWNTVLYNLNKKEEIEININWENSYGILDNGKYRLVKNNLRKKNSPESRSYTVYAEFIIGGKNNIIEIKKLSQNINEYKEYLEKDGRKIYLANNIEEVYFNKDKDNMTLKYYIENVNKKMEESIKEITNYLEKKEIYKDGGSTVYRSKEYDITLVKCNNMSGNKDIYIGDYNLNTDGITMCSR